MAAGIELSTRNLHKCVCACRIFICTAIFLHLITGNDHFDAWEVVLATRRWKWWNQPVPKTSATPKKPLRNCSLFFWTAWWMILRKQLMSPIALWNPVGDWIFLCRRDFLIYRLLKAFGCFQMLTVFGGVQGSLPRNPGCAVIVDWEVLHKKTTF